MVANTANGKIEQLAKNWVPGPASDPNAFAWSGVYTGTSTRVPEPGSLRAIRSLQHGLVQDGPELGLARLRHEAPRRLRVAGRDIRPGAKLVLFVPNDKTTPPPYAELRPMIPLVVPVFATADLHDGLPVWESAVELEAQVVYMLMLGGPAAPGVEQALGNRLPEPPAKGTFLPGVWNRHWTWIVNEDRTFGTGGWQALRL
jgi:hypothetical protein